DKDDAALEGHKLARDFVQPIERKPCVKRDVLAVYISGLTQPPEERLGILAFDTLDGADPWKLSCRVLRARCDRPSRRAAQQSDEPASFQPIKMHSLPL